MDRLRNPHYKNERSVGRDLRCNRRMDCFDVSPGQKAQPHSIPRAVLRPIPVGLPQRHASGTHSINGELATRPIPEPPVVRQLKSEGIPGCSAATEV